MPDTDDKDMNRNSALVRKYCHQFDSNNAKGKFYSCLDRLETGSMVKLFYGQCASLVYKRNSDETFIKASVCRLLQALSTMCRKEDWRSDANCG